MPGIKKMLTGLRKPVRQTLLLQSDGYSYNEIAAITGVSIGTVKSRLHYARKRAQAELVAYR